MSDLYKDSALILLELENKPNLSAKSLLYRKSTKKELKAPFKAIFALVNETLKRNLYKLFLKIT